MDKRSLKLPIGQQIPEFGLGREAQVQRAIAMEMQAIARELFIRAASGMLDKITEPDDYREIARRCSTAARAYFEGLGVIQAENPVDSGSQENT